MAWQQLVTPNTDITEKAGMCLSYSRRAFGAPAVEPTAWDAWTKAKYRHEDRAFPEGVAHPVWFYWKNKLPGDTVAQEYGHVAVRKADGKIWSSPLSGVGRAWFNSVDDLVRAFGGGMRYVGWSEDISGVKVIEMKGDDMRNPTKDEVVHAFMFGMGAEPTEKQINDYTTNPTGWLALFDDIMTIRNDQVKAARPSKEDVESAFKLLGYPPSGDDQVSYYMSRDKAVLWSDVAKALVKQQADGSEYVRLDQPVFVRKVKETK
ncbi:hypothetical protein [Mycolicibacterium wolinskyi]|uniref:hypothetical protein n=1 Tax=Mycolicibacterium wolinskyi TaxID=59750 RepID=UPI003917A6DE